MQAVPDGHRLLPHERLAVRNLARRNMVSRNRYLAAMHRRNGPQGVFWWSAALGSIWFGMPLFFVGLGLLVFGSGDGALPKSGPVPEAGAWLLLVDVLLVVLFAVRAFQCHIAGVAYRRERSLEGSGAEHLDPSGNV